MAEDVKVNVKITGVVIEAEGDAVPAAMAAFGELLGGLLPRPTMTHYWRVKTKLPERQHQRCRVLARGEKNSCLVEFEDGFQVITSRNFVQKLKKD